MYIPEFCSGIRFTKIVSSDKKYDTTNFLWVSTFPFITNLAENLKTWLSKPSRSLFINLKKSRWGALGSKPPQLVRESASLPNPVYKVESQEF